MQLFQLSNVKVCDITQTILNHKYINNISIIYFYTHIKNLDNENSETIKQLFNYMKFYIFSFIKAILIQIPSYMVLEMVYYVKTQIYTFLIQYTKKNQESILKFCGKVVNIYLKQCYQNQPLTIFLIFKDQHIEDKYKQLQGEQSILGQIIVEIFKALLEITIGYNSFRNYDDKLNGILFIILSLNSLFTIYLLRKQFQLSDYMRIFHVIVFQILLIRQIQQQTPITQQQLIELSIYYIYSIYISISITYPKLLIVYFCLQQLFWQWMMFNQDSYKSTNTCMSLIFLCCILVASYIKERTSRVEFHKTYIRTKDLQNQEYLLNNSLSQYLIIAKMNDGFEPKFDVQFANDSCLKHFGKPEEIQFKTTQIYLRQGQECNLNFQNYSTFKFNASQEQILDRFKNSHEQTFIVDKQINLNQFLQSYDLCKNKQNQQPTKINCYTNDEQSYEVNVSNCFWNGDDSLLICIQDISDRAKINQLEQTGQYKDRILATVTHDLKNPISNLQTTIQIVTDQLNLLDKQEQINECISYLKMCQNIIIMLQSFVNDLQDFSQIKQQKLKLNIQQFQVKELLNEIKQVYQPQVVQKCINLNVLCDVKLDKCINDALRIKQVLFNLISNSLKFTQNGEINISVTDNIKEIQMFGQNVTEQIEQNGCSIDITNLNKIQSKVYLITITDTGHGIDEQIQRQLFKNFSTFDSNNLNRFGVGLGLTICKQLCGYIGPLQYIYLCSKLNRGSTFQFLIYKNQRYQQFIEFQGTNDQFQSVDSIDYEIQIQSPFRQISTPQHNSLNRQQYTERIYKVLLVDDELFNLITLRQLLKNIDIKNIDFAQDGVEAIQKMKQQKHDFVFLDLNMPIMNGLQCLRELRKITNKSKIYICSAFADSETIQQCRIYGATDYLNKPVNMQTLKTLFF
ncbi:hypothetical protein pb186bvf_012808 [Paramecium bursaria]